MMLVAEWLENTLKRVSPGHKDRRRNVELKKEVSLWLVEQALAVIRFTQC